MPRVHIPEILLALLFAFMAFSSDSFGQAAPSAELNVARCWTTSDITGGRAVSVDGDSIFVGSGQGQIGALSTAGALLWSSELGGRVSSNLLVLDTALLAVTSVVAGDTLESVDLLRSLSKVTGVTNWIAKLPSSVKYTLGSHNGDIVVVGSSGYVIAVDQKSGAIKWNRPFPPLTAEPIFSRGKLLLATEGQQLITVSLGTGEPETTRKLPGNASVIAEYGPTQILTGDERGNLYLLNGTEKPVWKFKSGGAITRIYAVIDYIVAVSNDNFVYHLLARNGDVDWKRRLSGRVAGAGVVSDKVVVTQSLDDPSVVFTDLQSGKVAGQVFVESGEALTANVTHSGDAIYLITDRGMHRVSIEGCPPAN